MYTTVTKAIVIENSAAVLLGRVINAAGVNLTQAATSTITVKVFDTSTGLQVGSTITPTISDVVYDTLQTDARWKKDRTGYNVAIAVAGSYWPTGGKTYQAEAKVTPTSGDPFYAVWKLDAQNIYSE